MVEYIGSGLTVLMINREQEADPDQQYLLKLEAQSTGATQEDIDRAIASHLAVENPHNITLE